VIERQHVWLGPEATTFEELCEACLSLREPVELDSLVVRGTLRREADVGFTRAGGGIASSCVASRVSSRAARPSP
jgi:hypothetical protein